MSQCLALTQVNAVVVYAYHLFKATSGILHDSLTDRVENEFHVSL